MADQVILTQEAFDELNAKIKVLEEKLAQREADGPKKKKKGKDRGEKWSKKMGDAVDKSSKETGRILKAVVEASSEALNETADAISSLSEDTDKERLGEVPSALISLMRRAIKIQRRAVDKFEESCGEVDDDDDDDDDDDRD